MVLSTVLSPIVTTKTYICARRRVDERNQQRHSKESATRHHHHHHHHHHPRVNYDLYLDEHVLRSETSKRIFGRFAHSNQQEHQILWRSGQACYRRRRSLGTVVRMPWLRSHRSGNAFARTYAACFHDCQIKAIIFLFRCCCTSAHNRFLRQPRATFGPTTDRTQQPIELILSNDTPAEFDPEKRSGGGHVFHELLLL
jgi:hypothetical protein